MKTPPARTKHSVENAVSQRRKGAVKTESALGRIAPHVSLIGGDGDTSAVCVIDRANANVALTVAVIRAAAAISARTIDKASTNTTIPNAVARVRNDFDKLLFD
jgi:hypothetical protein